MLRIQLHGLGEAGRRTFHISQAYKDDSVIVLGIRIVRMQLHRVALDGKGDTRPTDPAGGGGAGGNPDDSPVATT